MLAMADHTLWVTLGVLLSSDATIYKKPHGDICMNALLWEYTYVS